MGTTMWAAPLGRKTIRAACLAVAGGTALPSTPKASCQSAAPPNQRSVLVIGGGVVGVTSAYALARAGYQVTVLEANNAVSLGTSQVNACSLRESTFSPIAKPS